MDPLALIIVIFICVACAVIADTLDLDGDE
jgi:hypothetical protein